MKTPALLIVAVLMVFAAIQTGYAAGCDRESVKKMIRQARKDGTLVQLYDTVPQQCPEYGGDPANAKAGRERLARLVGDVRRESEMRQGGGGGGGAPHH